MAASLPALPKGATIGILGGGQLGRMLAQAAEKLGFKCHVYSPEADSCAFEVVQAKTCAPYEDKAALARFADAVDRITYEFENVPAASAEFLAARKPVLPGPKVLANTQDRLVEKNFVAGLGIATAPYAPVTSSAELKAALARIETPAVLKTLRLGYDGKGQVAIKKPEQAEAAWQELERQPSILEKFIAFEREISVVAARGADGAFVAYEPVENEHRNHILYRSTVPAKISPALAAEAISIARRLAEALDYVGVLAVEMFEAQGRLLVNEIAPRVHNSGHWTLDGASISQFEQHIRAVAGWPLMQPKRLGRAEMINLIGDDVHDPARIASGTGWRVHLYGKGEARPGRKMGHVTRVMLD